MDRLEGMRLFVRVAEAGSFTAVAQQMNVARSVVTRQVAALESYLGSKLIARSTRRLSLTSAGAAYLEKCREILNLVEEAETGLAESQWAPRGQMRVSVPLSFGIRHLMPLLTDFTVKYPEVSLDIDFSDRRTNLIEEGFDLAIRITPALEETVVARKLSACRAVVVAAPAYLDRFGTPRHPEELIRHECFGYAPALRDSWPFLIEGVLRWVPTRGRIRANNGDALLDAAIRGLGIAFQPTFIAAPAVDAGLLRVILADYPSPEMAIYAVFPGNRYVPHRVRALVDYLAERIGPEPYWDKH